jgi:hypothetical protein
MVVVPFGCSTSKRPQVHLRRWRSATHHSFLIYRTYRQHADVRKFLASVLVERSGSRVAAAAEVGDADAHTQAMLDADAADAAEELSREEMEAVEMEAVEASVAKPARRLVDLDCHYDFRVVWDRVRQVFFAVLPRPKRTRRAAAPPLSATSRAQRVVALDPNQRNLFGAFSNNGLWLVIAADCCEAFYRLGWKLSKVQSTRSLAWNDLVALKSDLPIARSIGDRIRLRHLEDRRDELKKVSYLSLLLLLLLLFFSLSSSLLLLLLFFFSFISSSFSSSSSLLLFHLFFFFFFFSSSSSSSLSSLLLLLFFFSFISSSLLLLLLFLSSL